MGPTTTCAGCRSSRRSSPTRWRAASGWASSPHRRSRRRWFAWRDGGAWAVGHEPRRRGPHVGHSTPRLRRRGPRACSARPLVVDLAPRFGTHARLRRAWPSESGGNAAYGDFWGYVLVAEGAAEAHARERPEGLGPRGAAPGRGGGGRAADRPPWGCGPARERRPGIQRDASTTTRCASCAEAPQPEHDGPCATLPADERRRIQSGRPRRARSAARRDDGARGARPATPPSAGPRPWRGDPGAAAPAIAASRRATRPAAGDARDRGRRHGTRGGPDRDDARRAA